jgi:hypothetical protein
MAQKKRRKRTKKENIIYVPEAGKRQRGRPKLPDGLARQHKLEYIAQWKKKHNAQLREMKLQKLYDTIKGSKTFDGVKQKLKDVRVPIDF